MNSWVVEQVKAVRRIDLVCALIGTSAWLTVIDKVVDLPEPWLFTTGPMLLLLICLWGPVFAGRQG